MILGRSLKKLDWKSERDGERGRHASTGLQRAARGSKQGCFSRGACGLDVEGSRGWLQGFFVESRGRLRFCRRREEGAACFLAWREERRGGTLREKRRGRR